MQWNFAGEKKKDPDSQEFQKMRKYQLPDLCNNGFQEVVKLQKDTFICDYVQPNLVKYSYGEDSLITNLATSQFFY